MKGLKDDPQTHKEIGGPRFVKIENLEIVKIGESEKEAGTEDIWKKMKVAILLIRHQGKGLEVVVDENLIHDMTNTTILMKNTRNGLVAVEEDQALWMQQDKLEESLDQLLD